MDTQLINQSAAMASQVGLLTWIIVSIVLFCGALVFVVLYQNSKREDRYAKLVEVHIANVITKIETHGLHIENYKEMVKEKMNGIEEANRMTKQEHGLMVTTLTQISATMIELAAIVRGFNRPVIDTIK